MAVKKWRDIRRGKPERLAEIREQVRAELLEANLKELRELAGKTQAEVAGAVGLTQGRVSQAEASEDHLVSTLKRYVEALGGELEIVARFGNRSVKLRGV